MRRRVAAALVLVLASLAACSDSKPSTPSVTWTEVDVGAEPVTLTGHGDQLLVGLRDRGAEVDPQLVVLEGGQRKQVTVTPSPASPYAFEAIWYSIAYDGKQLLALGGAAGGAHSNTRWTVWTGSVDGGLAERPQEFNTFGGQTAGALYSAVITPSGRALLGSWGGVKTGNDGAVWLPESDAKWVRQNPARTALQSTPSLLVGPSFGTALGDSIVLVGSQVRLAPNVVAQEAAIWRSAKLNFGWQAMALPDPGKRSHAMTASCTPISCLVSGYVDDRLALWHVERSGPAKRMSGVPAIPVGDKDELPPPMVVGDEIVQIVAQDNKAKVVSGHDGSWTVRESAAGPEGLVTDAALTDSGELYLIAGTSLWKTRLN
ncbi:hypothetical protein E1218_27320 [Kribbella turkmenica]|uniref:Uncharacterized protein n=1 Tax=Kribbella turkmenica TaxID=2530375 RepID=A0A4R4WFN6_9ACTN|nr:hypothetical protein [Kribbella turkmenica]TDD17789.1 hypothetical protein E1218_27320 [Kribbella turkmenica]